MGWLQHLDHLHHLLKLDRQFPQHRGRHDRRFEYEEGRLHLGSHNLVFPCPDN
jgi:hypothetical protein